MTIRAVAALYVALGQLPQRDRDIFVLRAVHDRSCARLAHDLGISRSRVDQIYRRTRDRLFFELLPWRDELLA